ncbi:hypothetical protein [Dyadobacter sp. 676]|uniref:Uncharacterized protein n=1 Tax=Dyadobacter sp. 676 TaxID=3088362 RepID=A0AAU8FQN9_9BACT
MKNTLYILIVIASLAVSCDDDVTSPKNDYEYFPLEVGSYTVYEVKEEIYSAGKTEPKTSSWQEKDQIIDKTDDGDSESFILARFTRSTGSDYWVKTKEFRINRTPDKILTSIDSETFFSLIFPVSESVRWNGNAYNNRDKEDYFYQDINRPYSESKQRFDNTLTVVERMDSSIINRYTGIKKYALGVGLIYDDQVSYEYCQTPECLESDIRVVESGTHRTRKILEFGTSK